MAVVPNYNPWGYGWSQQYSTPVTNQMPQQQDFSNFITVPINGGEATANAYPVASGNTVVLIDFELGKFWLKSNTNGIPQRLRAFSFSEDIKDAQTPANNGISRAEFDALSASVNKLIAELGGQNE